MTREILPLAIGKRTVELPFETRGEVRELITALADLMLKLPDDGHGLLALIAVDEDGVVQPGEPAPEPLPQRTPGSTLADGEVWRLTPAGEAALDAETRTDGLLCDCGNRLPWPVAGSDTECGCGNVWEHDGVDIGAGARLKTSRWKADDAPGEILPCPEHHPATSTPCARLSGHPLPHKPLHGSEWGGEPHHATDGEPRCEAYDDIDGEGRICNAQKYHGGTWHLMYGDDGMVAYRWPVADDYHPSRWNPPQQDAGTGAAETAEVRA